MYYLDDYDEKLLAKLLVVIGIALLALWFDLRAVYIIFPMMFLVIILFAVSTENIIIKSASFILVIYIFTFLINVIKNIPKDFLLYCGLGCFGIGLFDLKSTTNYKTRQQIMLISLIVLLGTFLYFSFFS